MQGEVSALGREQAPSTRACACLRLSAAADRWRNAPSRTRRPRVADSSVQEARNHNTHPRCRKIIYFSARLPTMTLVTCAHPGEPIAEPDTRAVVIAFSLALRSRRSCLGSYGPGACGMTPTADVTLSRRRHQGGNAHQPQTGAHGTVRGKSSYALSSVHRAV